MCVTMCVCVCVCVAAYTCFATLIFIMIGFFLAKKENIVVPNAVEKSQTGAFRSQDQTLSFFSG